MEVSPNQRADRISVSNQALKRLEPKSVRSGKGHEQSLFGTDNWFLYQRILQGRWEGSTGTANGCAATKMASDTAFLKVHFLWDIQSAKKILNAEISFLCFCLG